MKKQILFFFLIFICCYTNLIAQCDNVAFGKPASSSGFYQPAPPAKALNENCNDGWHAGGYAPHFLQVDLQAVYTINNINIMFEMSPNGNVNHNIMTSPDMVSWTVVDVISGFYVTGQLIERCYSGSPLTNVRGVRINSNSSPSWIAIREVGVYTLSAPAIPVITASSPLTFCQGNSVTLTSSTAFSYLWSTGATTKSITVNSTGVYDVTTNQTPVCTRGTTTCTTCGVGTASVTVTVNPLPVISVTPSAPSTCMGSSLSSVILKADGADTYSWAPITSLSTGTGDSVSASPSATSTYTVTGTDSLGCVNTATVTLTVNPKPDVEVRGSGNPLCDSTKLNWASWGTVNGTSGAGTISSDLSILVTKPTGGLSTTSGMNNGGVFPTQYNVPVNNTSIRNDLAGVFTFCFNRPVINPQIALSSIGDPSNSVQINTTQPYQVIWTGIGMSYPNNTTFIGTEGFTIIQFPGIHTCISFDYLQSETYCNIAFGTRDTSCQSFVSPPICWGGSSDTLIASGAVSYSWFPTYGLNTNTGAFVVASPLVTTTYYVTGTDANNCSDTDSITIEVIPLPTITLTGDTIICVGDSASLTASGGGTYLWMPGNSTDSVITVSPTTTTTYTVSVTNSSGCVDSSLITVVVNPLPQALFTMDSVCLNDQMIFNDASTDSILSWNWNYGDGASSIMQNEAHTYATCGDYMVKLAVTSTEGCKDSISKMARVYCLPVADFSFTEVCLNKVLNFIDLSIVLDDTVSGWSWDFGDSSPLSAVQNATHIYNNAGTYPVSLIAMSSNGCQDTTIKNVYVHPLPEAKISTTNVCDGSIVPFTDLSTIPSPDLIQSWTWDFGDGSPFSSAQTASHQYSTAGSYTSELLVVSDFGCMDSITETVIVFPNPVVNFTADDTTGCAPLCISFQNLSVVSTGNIVQWSWDVGDASSVINSQNFDHCYANLSVDSSAYFNVTLTVTSDSGCVTTYIKNNYITVYPNPVADFSVQPPNTTIINPVISFIDSSEGVDIWNWDFGDGSTTLSAGLGYPSNPNQISYTYADTGTYLVTLITTTQYGCVSSAYKTIIIKPDFVFYIPEAFSPNGDSKNDFFAGKGLFIKEYEMTIFDRWGNLIYYTNDIERPWDGRVNNIGEIAQRDVYLYSITIIDINKQKHYYKGIVTLVR